MNIAANTRVQELARRAVQTGAPLTQADVDRLKSETGATEKEIRTGFLQALKALEIGVSANEGVGRSTQQLRQGMGDGVGTQFLGQKVADSRTTPALQGANLKVPGSLEVFRNIADQLQHVARGLKDGTLDLAGAQVALNALPLASDGAKDSLWQPGGEAVRVEVNSAIAAVSFLAPELRMAGSPYTLGETALQNKILTFKLEGEAELKEMAAAELVARYPASALAPWAQSEAIRDPLKGMAFEPAVQLLTRWSEGKASAGLEVSSDGLQFLVQLLGEQKYERFQAPSRLPPGVSFAALDGMCATLAKGADIDGPDGKMRASDWGTLRELLAPYQGKEALPTFQSGAHTLADCSLVLRGDKVLIDATRNERLLSQGFTKEPGTELLHPPRDDKGWYRPGTYELPGAAKLVIGTHNDVKLDLNRVLDRDFDRLMEQLPKRGFTADNASGLLALPRA